MKRICSFLLLCIAIINSAFSMEVPEARPAEGPTLRLFDAIAAGNVAKLEQALSQGVDLKASVVYEGKVREPYMFALEQEKGEAIANKLKSEILSSPKTKNFFKAARDGDINIIKNGKSETLLNIQNEEGNTAPMIAVKNGRVSVVQELLGGVRYRVLIDERNNDGDTLLMLAIKNPNKQIIETILPLIPNPLLKNNGENAKDLANKIKDNNLREEVLGILKIAEDRANLINSILDPDSNIDDIEKLITPASNTLLKNITSVDRHPLVFAIKQRRLDIVKLLVNKDVTIVNQKLTYEMTPLGAAIDSSPTGLWYEEFGGQAQKALFLEIIRFLLENKADPNARDIAFNQPVLFSAITGQVPLEIMTLLVEYKANINYQNPPDNTTPLMKAVYIAVSSQIVKKLLDLGADPLMKNLEGKTAFDIAEDVRKEEINPFKKIALENSASIIKQKIEEKMLLSDVISFTQTLKSLENTLRFRA